ncbi:hypothetical protein SEUCBS140593_004933 [Sporothrix eucalyptigena]|uniref:Uncharacterized protein n=1 Tax=Sporothrix eucalyptigena TaxID=1812306 RepID=A0ABP0BTT0_9PEZI
MDQGLPKRRRLDDDGVLCIPAPSLQGSFLPGTSLDPPVSYAISPTVPQTGSQEALLVDLQAQSGISQFNPSDWMCSPNLWPAPLSSPPSAPPPPADPEILCFGRITAIAGRWEHRNLDRPPSGRFPVQLLSSSSFALVGDNDGSCGRIDTGHGPVVHGLLEETTLELHVTCTMDDAADVSRVSRVSQPCQLDMTLYGPADLLDELGTWLEDNEIFLQDPVDCHAGRDVVYRNPQRLSVALDPASCSCVSVFLLQQKQSSSSLHMVLQDRTSEPDVLEILSNHMDLEEAAQPASIQTDLKSHQKQALTFMLQRERGWAFDGHSQRPDLWQLVDTSAGRVFLNHISDSCQADEPRAFSGGIIADPMGLGKTLTMISLVATDLDSDYSQGLDVPWRNGGVEDEHEGNRKHVPATLIIIPAPRMSSNRHVHHGQMQYRRHHGKTRLTSIDELHGIHIVVTSYDTVAAEWKAGCSSVLFCVHWRRIILDEAHFIRNGSAIRAKAACALAAVSRWAVTGTPIQNRLSDLSALLAFVRAHPYTDPKVFDADIARPWKAGDVEKATKRLKLLSSYLILRRPKTAIRLPARHDLLYPIDLAPAERALYDAIHAQALVKIDEAIHTDTESSRAGVYANVLQKIESLRLVCDLGLHYTRGGNAKNGDIKPDSDQEQCEWACNAQNVFNMQRNLGPVVCRQCSSTLELTEVLFVGDSLAMFSRCLKFTCSECAKKLPSSSQKMACGHQPSCPVAPVSTSSAVWEEAPHAFGLATGTLPGSADEDIRLPSKIEALLDDLRTLPPGTKCIVFSTWRLTLDLIQRGLDQFRIPCLRFDGKVPQKDRQPVVDRFRNDCSIRVLLLTLSCGAVGLTLTAATRAYLVEPHWNPTLEEQALARIHRLGQTQPVTTVRFYVRNSFEEQVIKLQESKKRLAGVLLSHHDTGQVDDNLDGLHDKY